MNTFGNIKSRIEKTSVNLYGKPVFKTFMNHFNKLVIENKDICELYYIYDDLTTNKGIDKSIADDYINESIEYSQILIESNKNKLSNLNNWIRLFEDENVTNNYKDIDNIVYNNNKIKNLESVLESKKNIINTLITEDKTKSLKESAMLPISSMVKIANESLKKELNYLNENEKKELGDILKLNGQELKNEFTKLQNSVINNLKTSLNESTENSLSNTLNQTIEKIKKSQCNHYEYYKLKKLSFEL
jgi:hypothetical protein